ncbi:glycosyltransferase family 9 protein [Herbaspirillum sp. RTI4]|uniref:glycosyltransferase family 9 protein n=1 Tax=Herbaspirillum sp. RTI4 TaxID=3048640 RepID=UPI002AB3C32F|nr:glycosyltransferase family 9 protein [Herbaspirillum sp. RTI4]MDY7577620.1 glycosyltransferase family 9 protein [Herbaspirillum sp. RTI4]MEA9982214.1 glycosyltransferase family 9 protein [Herbaspirillum sp. RTI4]
MALIKWIKIVMRPNTLKKIDDTLGRILLVLLRPLVFVIDAIGKKRRITSAPEKISFLKILGGGSLLIAYPAILSIRCRYPQARLVLICAKEVKVYAELTDLFDEILEIQTGSARQVVVSSAKALLGCFGSDIFVNYELHSKLSAIFTLLSFSKERYGLYQDWNRWQERYINHPVFYNSATPIYVGYEQIAKKIGAATINWTDACAHFQTFLEYQNNAVHEDMARVGVAAYCSDLYKERQFSNAEFSQIIHRHLPSNPVTVVLLGGKNDCSDAAQLKPLIEAFRGDVEVSNLTGQTSLRDVVTQFQSMTFLVSIDSGLNHIARLLQLRTITYWGPSDPGLRLKGLDALRDVVMYKKLSCAPCVHLIDVPPCKGNNLCMKQFLNGDADAQSNEGWEIS